jgi:hypothetical protein
LVHSHVIPASVSRTGTIGYPSALQFGNGCLSSHLDNVMDVKLV